MRSRVRGVAAVVATVALVVAVSSCSGASSAGTAGTPSSGGSSGSASTEPSSSASATSSASPSASAGGGLPRPEHVVVVVMENHGYASVVGNSAARWTNALPAAVFTDWHAVRHPSQPNYLALFSGSTQGVTNDKCPQSFSAGNLGQQLIAKALTFTGYSEGLPAVGATDCKVGRYARKHNPWSDFTNVPATVSQPFSAFPTDYSKLPTVSFVIPDLCNDTHNCSIATGDAWLASKLGPYATWAATHNSLLILTYDEDDAGAGPSNHIPTLFVGQSVKPGSYDGHRDHYTLLRTLEDFYGLSPLANAAGATAVTDIWAAE